MKEGKERKEGVFHSLRAQHKVIIEEEEEEEAEKKPENIAV